MFRCVLAFCAVLLAAVLLASCGGTRTVTRTVTVPQKVTTAPPSVAPETSIVPSGPGNPSPAKPEAPPVGVALAASLQKTASSNGLRLIEGFEGFGACPYWDAYGGVWTRGFGETEGIHAGSACISRSYGESNLRYRLQRYYEWALRGLHVSLNQNQWDALDSFVWNLGAGIFQGTTLGAELRAGQFRAAASNMLQYVHAGGQVLAGLVTRRRAEVALFLRPVAAAHLTAAQLRQRRLRALHTQEGLRRALHNDIERHHCRKGQHATPRRYHTLCGHWLKAGDHAIRLINHYRRLLHLARVSSVHRPAFKLVPVPRTRKVSAVAASAATVSPVPHGPSGSWAVAYADDFTVPLSTDTTVKAHETEAGKRGCCNNSEEIMVERPSKVRQGALGLELLCSHEANGGQPYTCGGVSTTAFKWRPGQGQTMVFEAVMQLPPRDLGEDPGWWSTDTAWTDEIDFLEAWEWGHEEYFAGIPCWLPKAGGGSDYCHEIYNAKSELNGPEANLHIYTSVVKPSGEIEEYVDGSYRWKLGPISGINTPLMRLILTHALRRSSNLAGTNSFTVRSIAVYEDSAHKGIGVEGGGLAPGTTLSGTEPAPEPTPTTTTETTPPPPPAAVPATPAGCAAATHREGTTSWLSASCSPSLGAVSYVLWRTETSAKSSTAKPGEPWTTGSTPSFTNHIGVKQNERYCYREAAVNASGQSAPSPDFCVTA